MNATQMIAYADLIDNRLGPVPGITADRLAKDLRVAAVGHDALIKALDGLVLVCGRTGDSFADFEEQAEAFRRETGFMRPGKDMPAAYGGEDDRDARREAYSRWVGVKIAQARSALVLS